MVASIFFTAAVIRALRVHVAMVGHTNLTSQARIIAAVKNIDAPMLTRVWQELEYRIDVCRVTHGAHVEHLLLSKNLFKFSCGCEQFH
jgi:hypothetical protein